MNPKTDIWDETSRSLRLLTSLPYPQLWPFVKLLVWIFFSASPANAEWIQRDSETDPSAIPGVIHQHVLLENSATGAESILDLVKFPQKSAHLRLIDNPDGRDLAAVLNRDNNAAGVNGGYFDENFKPLGLRIADGRKLSPVVRARLLTGVVISSSLKTQILRLEEFAKMNRPPTAIQCGPFLIDRGAAVAGLDCKHAARRSFVAIGGPGDVLVGYCSNASLAELPEMLMAGADDIKIQRALNLDGGSSSGFWFKRKDGSILSIPEQKNVRDFIVVTK